jgi:glycosyltransferase involved in cell wall biosynthesis
LKKLVIISHTAHQLHPEHGPVGWGPTVREINFLAAHWDEVVHVACLEEAQPAGSSLPYSSGNIRFIPIPTFGGAHWWQKFDVLFKAPKVLFAVHNAIKGATEVQLRLPMSIGVFLLPYFKWFAKRTFKLWVKYATNWGQPSQSAAYRWQQRLLRNNWLNCPVTINGSWPDQPAHCKTFENPCLTAVQYAAGAAIAANKSLEPPFTVIFIGRVDAAKGVDLIVDSLVDWPRDKIARFHIIGEGPMLEPLKNRLEALHIPVVSHGFITQEAIFELLKESHFLVLPSRSEGFPKVVAEGLNFGCLPVVSAVGSLSSYIKHNHNGLLLESVSAEAVSSAVQVASSLEKNKQQKMIAAGRMLAHGFTFEAYMDLLKRKVLGVP